MSVTERGPQNVRLRKTFDVASICIRRVAVLLVLPLILATGAASAQQVEYHVNNEFSAEEIVAAAQQASASALQNAGVSQGALNSQISRSEHGSFSQAVQYGANQKSSSYSNNSLGSTIYAVQLGEGNVAQAIIEDSPDSVIAQFQAGHDLTSNVLIVGGNSNAVATGQVGSNLGLNIALVDSTGTTVVWGQLGSGYSGNVTFRNAPAGTTITVK